MPERPSRIHFVANRGDVRLRLDQVLVRHVVEVVRMSRSKAQSWIEGGAVYVNGGRALRPAMRVREGAAIDITLPDNTERRARPAPERRDLEILYEDEHLVVIDKPAGLVVHPSYKNASGTLLNALLGRFESDASIRPGIVTRLDKHTSGALLVALTSGVHARLQRLPIEKQYLAIVVGHPLPQHGTIDLPLGRDARDRRRVVVVEGGQPSTTHYEVIASADGRSLVRCELVTGRTHQIRVHLAARGWPVIGDAVYGVADDSMARTALHAWRVRFTHPISGGEIDVIAPMPEDMRRFTLFEEASQGHHRVTTGSPERSERSRKE